MNNIIKELRKERRISQEELANAVQVTRQTIISLENGKYNASLLLAHEIAKYFGKTIAILSRKLYNNRDKIKERFHGR